MRSRSSSRTATPQPPVKATPLPKKELLALLFVLVNESVSATLLFPFIGFYVAHLLNVTKERAGYTSGILLSVFMVGQFLSGKTWGRLSDVYGRRPIMLFSLFMSGVVMLVFGLSPNFYFAMGMRLIHGLTNGNVGIAKAVIAELTDKTNDSKGFALISFAYGIGNLIGPFLGGLLYDPANSQPLSSWNIQPDSVLGRYPALLPCIASSVYTFVAFAISCKTLPETNKKAIPINLMGFMRFGNPRLPSASPSAVSSPTMTGDNLDLSSAKKKSKFGYKEVYGDEKMRTSTLMYVVLCGASFALNEIFPLWAIASREHGGMALSAATVGYINLAGGIAIVLCNVSFPVALQLWGGHRLSFWQWCCLECAVLVFAIPLAADMFTKSNAIIVIVALQMVRVAFESWSFVSVFLFIGASAPRDNLGAVNSIAQSSGCVARAIVPLLITPLFALSINYPIPSIGFNYYTTFVLTSLMLVAGYYLSTKVKADFSHAEATLNEKEDATMDECFRNEEEVSVKGSGLVVI